MLYYGFGSEERFDDRDLIRTNLIESYFRLFQFISKHLPDPFYLEGDVRKSVRDIIARELCVNLVIHREYSNPYITRLVISKNELMTENANRPRMIGYIDVHDFVPYPKNPIIAKFFNEIGLADELGSGIKKIAKYLQVYSKDFPTFKEADIFIVKIPLHCFDSTTQVTTQVEFSGKYENIIMHFCEFAKSSREIREYIGIKNQRYFMKSILNPMVQKGLIVLTIPDKPRSSKQKYIVKK
ncbi:divergent AAA domain DNA binding protein [Mycoplasma sp. CAG:776]|nr:divergent AAA domain DNA binding protein [Mycoplasma sp. CAG:776]